MNLIKYKSIRNVVSRLHGDDVRVGNVKFNDGTPLVNNPIYLFKQGEPPQAVDITYTDKNGDYKFEQINLKKGPYMIIISDSKARKSGKIIDWIIE